MLIDKEMIRSLSVKTKGVEVQLEKKSNQWWVTSPHNYPADEDFIEKNISIMASQPSLNHFPFQSDLFGFEPGQAQFVFKNQDGTRHEYRIGQQLGPQQSLYVLNKANKTVYVVHNVWGQFLFFPQERYYSQSLPLPGKQVREISFKEDGELKWQVSPHDAKSLKVFWDGREVVSSKAKWLWFFKKVREFPVEKLIFNQEKIEHWTSELKIATDKGNIRFLFNRAYNKIHITNWNAFGQIEKSSLDSLSYEIKKVIKSDKK